MRDPVNRPPAHPAELGVGGHRLPAEPGPDRHVDGPRLLVDNIVSVARLAKTFDLPVVLSTINVANGQGPTIPELRAVLADEPGDRPDRDQLVGGRRLPARRRGDRSQEADHGRAVDRGVPGVPGARRTSRRLRGVSRSSTPWVARRPRRTGPGSNGSSRRARSRSAGCRSPASSSATGLESTPSRTSSTSCSRPACWRTSDRPTASRSRSCI